MSHSFKTLGESLVAALFAALLFWTLSLTLSPMTPYTAAGGVVTFFVTISAWTYHQEKSLKPILLHLFIGSMLLIISGLIGGMLFDTSYDGQNYHMSAVIGMIEGWQPHYQAQPTPPELHSLWVDVYPKTAWILQAGIGTLLPFEMTKGLTLLLLFITGLIVYGILQDLTYSPLSSFIAAVIASCNPIALVQWPTFYNDGIVASLFTIIIVSGSYACLKNHTPSLIISGMAAIMVAGLKFSTLVLGGALFLPLLITFFYRHKTKRRATGALLAIGIIAAGFTLWEPYGNNWIQNGHPFWPIMGENTRDFMTGNTPVAIESSGYIVARIAGLTATADGIQGWENIKNSFLFSAVYDQRIGGFGPLMGLILLTSLLTVVLLLRHKKNPIVKTGFLILGLTIFSFLIHPEGWWARYIPQLWIACLIPGILAVKTANSLSPTRIVGGTLLGLMLLNSIGMGITGYKLAKDRDTLAQADIRSLQQAQTVYADPGNKFGALLTRLEDEGVLLIRTKPDCPDPIPLMFSGGRTFCPEKEQNQ